MPYFAYQLSRRPRRIRQKKGVYRLGTKTVKMAEGGMDVKTVGHDNNVRLLVTSLDAPKTTWRAGRGSGPRHLAAAPAHGHDVSRLRGTGAAAR
jgi:hypothetical protein